MLHHNDLDQRTLFQRLRTSEIQLAGNKRLMIYGTLHCKSGKRMNKSNRVFFNTEDDALKAGFRPCGHCMPRAYKRWKHGVI